jgi:hypothetical protein
MTKESFFSLVIGLCWTGLFGGVLNQAFGESVHPGTPHRALPVPASTLVAGLEFTAPPSKYPGTGTDMHWWTWGADGAVYCVDDDGKNFNHPWNFAHLLRVRGIPPDHQVEEVSRFPGLKRYAVERVRYVCGAVAIGKQLFVAAYDYDYSIPGTERWKVVHGQENRPVADDNLTKMLDAFSQLAGVVTFMTSSDGGVTWQNLPGRDSPYILGPKFGGLAFVGFGPGYTGVPPFLGDYVYAISNDESWETGNHVFLARVPKASFPDRKSWQFYAGVGGDPAWSSDESRSRPVYSDHGHVGHPTMTYNAGLRRFLLAYSSDRVPHSLALPPETAAATWHRARELVILEGPTPWGPWSWIHQDEYWEGDHLAYLPQIPSAWLTADGVRGTLLFSGDYRQFGPPPPPRDSVYGFMTRSFRLLLRK